MSVFINIINYVFDMFILLIYFDHVLKKKKDYIPAPVFYGAFVLMECIMFITSVIFTGAHSNASFFITSLISFITTFALCFLYETTVRHRLFTSLLFQIFALLGEGIFSIIITKFKTDILLLNDVLLSAVMNLGSKLILLLLVLICIAFWDRKMKHSIPNYNLMLFVTPAITLFITLSIPSSRMISLNLNSFYISLFTSLIILILSTILCWIMLYSCQSCAPKTFICSSRLRSRRTSTSSYPPPTGNPEVLSMIRRSIISVSNPISKIWNLTSWTNI